MIRLHGLAADLCREIGAIPVIDCHEHLPPESVRVSTPVDVLSLFSHYCGGDIEAAGLSQEEQKVVLLDASRPLAERWARLRDILPAIRFGGYCIPPFAYVRDVLGFDDINDATYQAISDRLAADNRPGLYQRLFAERCGIERVIECVDEPYSGTDHHPLFVYLFKSRACPRGAFGLDTVAELEKRGDRAIGTLAQCVDALRCRVDQQRQAGAVGLKIAAAYRRPIEFADVPAADAERIFTQLRRGGDCPPGPADIRALEDYLLRREVEAAIDADLVVAIHTGYQAGNRNDIRNARAVLLCSLLQSYPQARFDLYHGSLPYVEDMVVLGKYFANVSLNLCWMHIIGPDLSRRALAEWLDAVPVTKLFAFGGDYLVPENVYGHLQLARANVAQVLADKVTMGRMTRAEAVEIARLMFRDNPKRWYKLD